MERIPYLIAASVGFFVIVLVGGIPGRIIGKRLYEDGVRQHKQWKRDLGEALYKYAFRLTLALALLVIVLLPQFVTGHSLFDG